LEKVNVNLSVKNVPEALAQRLRERARRNRRSLQRELLSILEAAASDQRSAASSAPPPRERISIEELAVRAQELFPRGTRSSVAYIRQMRDER
jgi:plasmid stability protein